MKTVSRVFEVVYLRRSSVAWRKWKNIETWLSFTSFS